MVLPAPRLVWKPKVATLDKTSGIAQNDYYEVLDKSNAIGIRVKSISVYQTNTDVAAKNITIRATVDGTALTDGGTDGALNDDSSKWGLIKDEIAYTGNTQALSSYTDANAGKAFRQEGNIGADNIGYFECNTFKLEVRTTSVPGTAQKITCFITYDELEAV